MLNRNTHPSTRTRNSSPSVTKNLAFLGVVTTFLSFLSRSQTLCGEITLQKIYTGRKKLHQHQLKSTAALKYISVLYHRWCIKLHNKLFYTAFSTLAIPILSIACHWQPSRPENAPLKLPWLPDLISFPIWHFLSGFLYFGGKVEPFSSSRTLTPFSLQTASPSGCSYSSWTLQRRKRLNCCNFSPPTGAFSACSAARRRGPIQDTTRLAPT